LRKKKETSKRSGQSKTMALELSSRERRISAVEDGTETQIVKGGELTPKLKRGGYRRKTFQRKKAVALR